MFTPRFGTAVTCIDGRIHMPVTRYMKARFSLDYIDIISEVGMDRYIGEARDPDSMESLLNKIRTSMDRHGSKCVAVVGHHDCAGNPVPPDMHIAQIRGAVSLLKNRLPQGTQVCGLYVNKRWSCMELR